MKLLKNIVLTIAGVFLLGVISLTLYAYLRRDRLASAFVEKINETINTKISYGTIRVTVFESFPGITVRFSDLLIEPSPYYNKAQFADEDNDTLLFASSLSLTAAIPSLLTGTVSIRSVTAREGALTLLRDRRGDVNYEVFSRESEGGKNIDLKNINIKGIETVWHDRSSNVRIEGIPAEASVRIRKSGNSLSIAKGSLDLGGLSFEVWGMVNYSSTSLDLSIEGKKIDVASLVKGLPDKWRLLTGGFSPSGIVDLRCKISGPYGDAGSPRIDLAYSLTGGRMSHTSTGLDVNNLSFSGGMTTGQPGRPETFLLSVDTLSATYGSAMLAAKFRMSNPSRPNIYLLLIGDINFNDLRKVFGTDFIRNQTGSVRGNIKMSGVLPDSLSHLVASLPSLDPEASLTFSDFGATFAASGLPFTNVNGSVVINKDLTASNLSFTLLDQNFLVNARMDNITDWIAGNTSPLMISGEVSTDRFVTAFFTDNKSDSAAAEKKPLNIFPPDITLKLRVRADSIISRNFRAGNFTSVLDYKPYIITFSDVRAQGLDGLLTGELMIARQNNGTHISRSRLEVTDIDLNKTFLTFNNFGQKFITSDNLFGRLTGDVTLMAPLGSNFRIETPSLVAEAHLSITKGRLVSFAPAESLSKFLDLDELRDIGFSKMENDIFIRNRTVSVPKMLINSSAGNFTIYGTHSFDGEYIYHIRVLLSEVMSREARERNRDVSAYDQVKVDGSGKATIPLRIEYINGETKVGYDFGQAQENIKEDFAEL
ncbi:MAG: AsmA-like C-terminal region-containing protein, partial [Bacteroidales bacterium]|nr:AsmA-like C-terminal region-containing protein [Bacteroidales bacterium]